MRLFVVEVNEGGAEGEYEPRDKFEARLRKDWVVSHTPCFHAGDKARLECEALQSTWRAELKALDEALLAAIDIAHVGMVLQYRLGWVFIAEDAPT